MSKPKITYTEPEVKQEPVVESEIVKAEVEFDEIAKTVSYTTTEGKEVIIVCPKTRQLIQVRKLAKKYDAADDEMEMAFLFMMACVTKYGDADKITYDECMDLPIQDSMTMVKCLEFFRTEMSALASMA